MLDKITQTVLRLSNLEENEINKLKIEAKLNEILSYLNRDDIPEDMCPVLCLAIAESLSSVSDNIQSKSEGDMHVTYFAKSPYSGKLEAYKVVRGIKKCSEETN